MSDLNHSIIVFGLFLAQAEVIGPWVAALINYGALGLWVIYLVWRDNRETQKQDQRHQENLASQKKVEEAFQSVTTSLIVGFGAMKNIDQGYADLLKKIEAEADHKRKGQ